MDPMPTSGVPRLRWLWGKDVGIVDNRESGLFVSASCERVDWLMELILAWEERVCTPGNGVHIYQGPHIYQGRSRCSLVLCLLVSGLVGPGRNLKH